MNQSKWIVINLTDGIIALPPTTRVLAETFVKEFSNRFKNQGYYLTSDGDKMRPEDVKLEVKKAVDTHIND